MQSEPTRVTSESRASVFSIETMTLADIPSVMEIERASFPLPWPEQAYRHELQHNPNSYFIVARAIARPEGNGRMPLSLIQRLLKRRLASPAPDRPIVGFGGLWMIVGEAHISTIATHPQWRGMGVGELLLVSMLREGQRHDADVATLEVRVSNMVAQNLYRKYRFEEVGRRKRYYRDNNEDALIMTVTTFTDPEYRAHLNALELALAMGLGQPHHGE